MMASGSNSTVHRHPDGSAWWVETADGSCIMCRDRGEIAISGRWVPCSCPAVTALNHRLRERVAELEALLADQHDQSSETP
jgi:hypothetical protein